MITSSNIVEYINYIHKLRNKSEAPNELIEKWKLVPAHELAIRLNQLYDSWNYTNIQREQIVQDFLRYQRVVQPKSTQIQNPVSIKNVSKKRSSLKAWIFTLIASGIIIGTCYVMYNYFIYCRLHYVYTLTERVAIRNEMQEQVGTMDLNATTNGSSFQRLLVADNTIYHKPIDSTGKLYDHRKVFLKYLSFIDYLRNDETTYGYVNAKFVVDSKAEFELYRRIFGQLSPSDNKRLQLKHRKVIAKSMEFDNSLKNLYLLSSCKSANEKVRKNNLSILVNELIPDNKYEIIARLSDGFYYQFIGDILSESYTKPRKIGFVVEPNREDEYVKGDYLFRYVSKEKRFVLTNCQGNILPYKAILNTEGVILYFEKQIIQENPLQPIEEFGESAIDIINTVGDAINKIIH
jgi:hypothetical protein